VAAGPVGISAGPADATLQFRSSQIEGQSASSRSTARTALATVSLKPASPATMSPSKNRERSSATRRFALSHRRIAQSFLGCGYEDHPRKLSRVASGSIPRPASSPGCVKSSLRDRSPMIGWRSLPFANPDRSYLWSVVRSDSLLLSSMIATKNVVIVRTQISCFEFGIETKSFSKVDAPRVATTKPALS